MAVLMTFTALIIYSPQAADSARSGLKLCAGLILPTLFPFFIVSILLNRLGFPLWLGNLLSPVSEKLFRVSGAGGSAFILGLCGGYPLGAAYIADMLRSGHITPDEAEKLLAFCNNSGPAFIIGAIGTGVFHSSAAGLMLYIVHILAAAFTGIIFRGRDAPVKRNCNVHIDSMNLAEALPLAVNQAVSNILSVCGFAVFFTVISGLLETGGIMSSASEKLAELLGTEQHWCRALLCGILELGSGTGAMQGLSLCPLNLSLASGLIGWGGLSVHCQTRSVLAGSSAKGALHTAGRLVNTGISAILAYFSALLLGIGS